MSGYVFEPSLRPSLPVTDSRSLFPVHRIYCVGRNYAAHALEMGGDPEREEPFFFSKPADAIVPGGGDVSYPPATADLHHEVELVVALGRRGVRLGPSECRRLILGYAVGIDFTRRDLQDEAKLRARPWDMAKGFDESAPCSPIAPVESVGHPREGRISLAVNEDVRQNAELTDMIWSPEEILAHLSRLVELAPGDLVFTGTPAGVGPVQPDDSYRAWIEPVGEISGSILGQRSNTG